MDIHSQIDNPPKVRIVDDDDGFRTAIVRVLNASGLETLSYRCVGEYLIAESQDLPGCMLIDIYMPGPSGLDLWDALSVRDLSPPAIFLTGCGDVPTSVRAMKAGAIDFISKPVEVSRLMESVRYALSVDATRRAEYCHRLEALQKYETLESVERAVFAGVVNGKLNKQLAGELDKCERTIKTYRAQVMLKLNVASLPELVQMARLLSSPTREIDRLGVRSHRLDPQQDECDDEYDSKLLLQKAASLNSAN